MAERNLHMSMAMTTPEDVDKAIKEGWPRQAQMLLTYNEVLYPTRFGGNSGKDPKKWKLAVPQVVIRSAGRFNLDCEMKACKSAYLYLKGLKEAEEKAKKDEMVGEVSNEVNNTVVHYATDGKAQMDAFKPANWNVRKGKKRKANSEKDDSGNDDDEEDDH